MATETLRRAADGEGLVEGGVAAKAAVEAKARAMGRKVRNFIERSLKVFWNPIECIGLWLLVCRVSV